MGSNKFSEIDRLKRLVNIYVFKKGTTKKIWNYPALVNPSRVGNTDLLAGYYLDFSQDADYPGLRDPQNVILVDYTGGIGVQYNPFFIGHYALACYEKYCKTGLQQYLDHFYDQAEWFVKNAFYKNDHEIAVWEYHFPWSHDLIPPWISSLAQSTALSTLLRAWLMSGEQRFLDVALCAFNSMDTEIEDGGVKHSTKDGVTFEESAILPANTVLNGFIFSIWGVLEFFIATGDPRAMELVKISADTLIQLLPKYDLGFWSRYHLYNSKTMLPSVSSTFYHNVHVAQLDVMGHLLPNAAFKSTASRWGKYEKNRMYRTIAVILKAMYKLIVY